MCHRVLEGRRVGGPGFRVAQYSGDTRRYSECRGTLSTLGVQGHLHLGALGEAAGSYPFSPKPWPVPPRHGMHTWTLEWSPPWGWGAHLPALACPEAGVASGLWNLGDHMPQTTN